MTKIRIQTRALFLASLMLALNSGAVHAGSADVTRPITRPSVDELTRQFRAIVFGTEFKEFKASGRIKKWTQPLRVTIKSYDEVKGNNSKGEVVVKLKQVRVKPSHLASVQQNLNALVNLTGLQTENANEYGSPANFEIKIVPRDQLTNPNLAKVDPKLLRRLGMQGGCYFLMWHNEDQGQIEKATIVVNADRIELRTQHCLLEEMAQSLGFPNDTDMAWASIFSNEGYISSLTRSDRIIIRALYDRRLKLAMEREEAMILVRKIIGELDRTEP
jgi:hypothetical protein